MGEGRARACSWAVESGLGKRKRGRGEIVKGRVWPFMKSGSNMPGEFSLWSKLGKLFRFLEVARGFGAESSDLSLGVPPVLIRVNTNTLMVCCPCTGKP